MALERVWIASPNYSSRSGGVRLLVVHTAEGALDFASLGSFFSDPGAEVSSHVGIDDTPGTIGEYVRAETGVAWTAGNVNGYSDQVELCAFADWSRAEWENHPAMLENLRRWLAEESARFGIPLVKSTSHGVCGHVDVSGPGGHYDPGPAFPWDLILEASPAPPEVSSPGPPVSSSAPPWPGRYLQYPPVMQGSDVATWQAQMVARGWHLDGGADGQYGPSSAGVCAAFQTEKSLEIDGIVGPDTWAATWSSPVT